MIFERGLVYHEQSIRKIITKLGFTAQKAIKLESQRDPKKRECLTETYLKIKSRASQEGARIHIEETR